MKITIATNEAEFDRIAAWRVIGEILHHPKAVIGLSTGRTTKNLHLIISDIYKRYPFDVSDITLFGVDEVINVPREYAGACYTMLKTELIDALGIGDDNFIMPPTISDNFDEACRHFLHAIESRGGIDLQLLGLGENGHLGFNQPDSPFENDVWITDMDDTLETRIRRETHTPAEKVLGGLTLGIKSIMRSRKILLVAKGTSKAEIVQKMIEGPITTDVPASILQLHPHCEFLLDTASASKLQLNTQKVKP